MRKFVTAAICLLSLSLSVTTRRKCIKEARTRTGKKCCEQQLRRVDKALSRAGDFPVKPESVYFVSCPKQGLEMEAVVLHRVFREFLS